MFTVTQLVGPSQYQNHNVNSMPSHGPPRVSYNSGDYVSDEVFATIDLLELDRSIPMAAQTSRPHAGKNGKPIKAQASNPIFFR